MSQPPPIITPPPLQLGAGRVVGFKLYDQRGHVTGLGRESFEAVPQPLLSNVSLTHILLSGSEPYPT